MSAGRYVEVICPKWISPFAYIRAVVTMIFSTAATTKFVIEWLLLPYLNATSYV